MPSFNSFGFWPLSDPKVLGQTDPFLSSCLFFPKLSEKIKYSPMPLLANSATQKRGTLVESVSGSQSGWGGGKHIRVTFQHKHVLPTCTHKGVFGLAGACFAKARRVILI